MNRPYHLGFVVIDLEEAMPRYERLLGVRFREPATRVLFAGEGEDLREPGSAGLAVHYTYSTTPEPPHLELLQALSGPVFGPQGGEGFHHVGVWVEDVAATQRAQREAGIETEGRYFDEDGVERVWFAAVDGVRGEFVNAAVRPAAEAFFAGWKARRPTP